MDGEEGDPLDHPIGIEKEGAPVGETILPMPEAFESAESIKVDDSRLGFVCPGSVGGLGGEDIADTEIAEDEVSGVLRVVEVGVEGVVGHLKEVENSMEEKDLVTEIDSEVNQARDSLFVAKDAAMTSGYCRAQKIEDDGNEEATTLFPQSDGGVKEEEFDDVKVGLDGVDKNEDEDEDKVKDKEVNTDSVLIYDMDVLHVVDSETNNEEHIVEVDRSQKAESPIADEKEMHNFENLIADEKEVYNLESAIANEKECRMETLPHHDFGEGTAMMEAELKMMEDEEAIVHNMDDCDSQPLGSPTVLARVEEDLTGTNALVSAGDDVMDALTADVEDDDLSTSGALSVEGGGRKKRGRPPKTNKVQTSKQSSLKKKIEEDVCFICFDGGNLVVCDRRGCPKVYHPSCVNHDEAFFRAKGRWNCGWHICSICEKTAHYMCYTCTYSVCKGCIKETVFACIRENKGLCETCKDTVMLIETNDLANKTMVNFDDKNTWEYLFKDYWLGLKGKLSITFDEITQAKKPSKKPSDEMYEVNDDAASSSDDSSVRHAGSKLGRKKQKRRSKVNINEDNSVVTPDSVRSSMSGENEWASKELLEFVSHMRGGEDTSVLSQFDFQALLLEYIKQNNLRDPRKKSQIICDKRLQSLFGKARVGHFEMLKLIESHFLIKDASQIAMDEDHGATGCDHDNRMADVEGSGDASTKNSEKRRKTRKKSGRTPLINDSDYAAVDTHNINLIYLRRNLMEDLLDDENCHLKVIGCFVRIRISGSGQKQDMYRIVQVVGTSKTEERYKTGKKSTDIALEILNLNKTEVIHIDTISNQDFTEEECKRLRQSIKCGLIRPMTVGELQEKAITLQAVRVNDVMCEAIGRYGWGYVPPTVNRLRGPLLEAEVATFEEMRKKHENKWSMEGCTLMSDGWTDQKGRTIINFLVNSAAGSFYLYSIDASSFEKTAEFIARTLDDAMQNVGIKNVVQICTDNAANYVRAGKILMDKYPHLYWTPCVAHCIDLILEDIGKIPTFKKVITSGRQITSYIYSHSILHSEFLQLSGNKELVRCGVTRFATSFLTLQSLRDNRYHLGKLDWQKWLEVGSGEEVHRNVFARAFWAGVEDCLKASQPLVALLRLVDSDHTPCMGFISQFFDKASSTIDTHFVDKPVLLKTLKGILKKRLEKHFNHDLFHAGAFLNPQFYYELKTTRVGFVKALEYEGGFQNCILRMIEDEEEQRVIMEQLTLYKEQKGHFASRLAIQALSNNDPMAWWGSFGITTPQLMIAARRILGLCCTASSCERNWSTFDFWLESEKLRLGHLRDRASDTGRRKELRECVEKLERLNTPEERSRRLTEIPKIHVDPNMDPAHESAEEDDSDDKRKGSYGSRLRESGSMRKGRELGSSGRSIASHDIRSAGRYGSNAPLDQSRNSSRDSFNYASDRKHESMETLNMVRGASLSSSALSNNQSPHPMAIGTGVSTASSVNETEKMWHYQDPSGKIQGPFSMVQLHKWNSTGYFPRELKIWKKSERQEYSILLADALVGRFQKEPTLLETSNAVSEGGWRGSTRGETMQTERYNLVQNESARSNTFSDTQHDNAWNSSRVDSVHSIVHDRNPNNSICERWNGRVANDSNLPAHPRSNTGGWSGDHSMENKSSVSIQPMATSRWDANSSQGVKTYQSSHKAIEPNSTVSGQIDHSHSSTLGRVSNLISVETSNKIIGNQPINEMKINVDMDAYKCPIYSSPTTNNEQHKSFSPDGKNFTPNVKQNGNSSDSMPSPTPTTNTTVFDAVSKVGRNPSSFIDGSNRTTTSAHSQTHPSSQTMAQSNVDQIPATSVVGNGASHNNTKVGWGGAVQANTNVNWGTLPQVSTGGCWANQAQGSGNMNVGMLPLSQGNPTANPLWIAQGQGNANTNTANWGMAMQGNHNPNVGWGAAALHANMNANWVAPPQGYSLNPSNWVPPTQQMQANVPTNVGWAAAVPPPAQTQVNPNANLGGYGPGWNNPPSGNSNGWVPPRIDNNDKQQHSDHSGRGFQRQ